MNRQQRRAAKREVEKIVFTQMVGVTEPEGLRFYWFECSQNFNPETDDIPRDAVLYGPFKSEAEVKENQRVILFGKDCAIEEGGMWDPAWDKPQ